MHESKSCLIMILEAQICKEIGAKRETTTPWLQNHHQICQAKIRVVYSPSPIRLAQNHHHHYHHCLNGSKLRKPTKIDRESN
uniref:Putative ovule protein n=1 Tax=Solanum chacoense TaxID=4108 RepID=A0A0V0HZ12_SOLCH